MADVIVLATADWDHPLWTNKQHTAVSLAALGHRVLYVESLGLRPPRKGAVDLPRILKRLRRVFVLRRVRTVSGSGHRWCCQVPPSLAQRLNGFWCQVSILPVLARFRSPLLWTYSP